MIVPKINNKEIDPETLHEIDLFLENHYTVSKSVADEMVKVELGMAQARGLERLTITTTRFSEIMNYVKRQTGKDTNNNNWGKIGGKLLEQLDGLEKKAEELSGDDINNSLNIKLVLVKGWINQVICHYLFGMKIEKDKKRKNDT